MGCTSSAPNVPEITQSTSETTENDITKDINIGDDAKEVNDTTPEKPESDINDGKVTKIEVLPTCDSLEENIQLARNSNSFTKIDNQEQKCDTDLTSAINNGDNLKNDDHLEQNKFTSLKAVADQVFINNLLEEIENTPITDEISNEETADDKEQNEIADAEEKSPELIEECNEELEDTKSQGNGEESASPSQSDGNRSTRWEALADIAAELPPSLAVDPVTGQIYSLTK